MFLSPDTKCYTISESSDQPNSGNLGPTSHWVNLGCQQAAFAKQFKILKPDFRSIYLFIFSPSRFGLSGHKSQDWYSNRRGIVFTRNILILHFRGLGRPKCEVFIHKISSKCLIQTVARTTNHFITCQPYWLQGPCTCSYGAEILQRHDFYVSWPSLKIWVQ